MPSLASIKLILALVGVFLVGAVAAIVMHKVDLAKLDALKLQYAAAEVTALQKAAADQKAMDDAAVQQAQAEATRQASIAALANSRPAEVRTHVVTKVISANCVPFGFVRVLDAAASGRHATDLPLPAGKSDDACSPLGWDAVAQSVAGNYGTSLANADQLNSLAASINDLRAIHNKDLKAK